jgi:hypothetical protein
MVGIRRSGGIAALVVAAGLLWTGSGDAGFTWPKGAAAPSIGGRTPIGSGRKTDDVDATVDALVASGKAKDTKDAQAKLGTIQDAALKAIALVNKHDSTVGERLRGMLRSGRLDIDFERSGPDDAVGSHVSVVDKNGLATDAINVHLAALTQAEGGKSIRATVALALTLYHEGIHAGQETPALKETDPQRQVAEARRNQCNKEIEAHSADIKVTDDLEAAVKSLKANPDFKPADGADALVKEVIAKLRDNRDAIDQLLSELDIQKTGSTYAKNRYETAKTAYQAFLDGKLTLAQLKEKIGQIPAGPSVVFEPLKRLIFVPVPTIGLIDQIGDGRDSLIETPFELIFDLDPLPDRGLLLVSGLIGGKGAVLAYRDSNGDGFYEGSPTSTVVTPTPLLTSNLELVDRQGTERVLVHDGASGALYPLLDGNHDGVPETLGPNAAAATPIPPDFVTLLMGADGTAYGFEGIAGTDDTFTTEEPTLLLRDDNLDGVFDRARVRSFGDRLALEPVVLGPLSAGDTTATVQAAAGSSLEVLAVDRATGYVNDLVATVDKMPSLAPLRIDLDRPLEPGEGLAIHDVTDGVFGQATLVSSPGADVHVEETPVADPVSSGDAADFRILVANDGGAPASDVTVSGEIPPVVAWAVDDPACRIAGGSLTCLLGELAPGEARVVHLTVPLHDDDCGGALFTIVGATATNESPFDEQDDETSATISVDCG